MIVLPLTDARRQRLESDATLVPTFLVTLEVGDDTYRLCDHSEDVVVGGDTYTATPDLLRTSHPAHRADQARDFWTLELSEPSALEAGGTAAQWQHRFDEVGHRSVTCQISLVFADETERNFTVSLPVYKGRLARLETVGNENGIITTAGFTGPLTRVDNEAARYTSDESQRQVDPNDTAFRFAHEGSEVAVEWRG